MITDLVVTGGRGFKDKNFVWRCLDVLRIKKKTNIHVGDALGVDTAVFNWVISKNEGPWFTYKADWNKYDKAAGPLRNKEMLEAAKKGQDPLVLAFPGGKGTANCIKQAKEMELDVLEVNRA